MFFISPRGWVNSLPSFFYIRFMKKLLAILIVTTTNFSFSQSFQERVLFDERSPKVYPPQLYINDLNIDSDAYQNDDQYAYSFAQWYGKRIGTNRSNYSIFEITALRYNKEENVYYNESIRIKNPDDIIKAHGVFANIKTRGYLGNRNIISFFQGVPLYHIVYSTNTLKPLSERYWGNGLPHGIWKVWEYKSYGENNLKLELVFFKGKLIEYRGFSNRIETKNIEKVLQEINDAGYHPNDWKSIYEKIKNNELITIF